MKDPRVLVEKFKLTHEVNLCTTELYNLFRLVVTKMMKKMSTGSDIRFKYFGSFQLDKKYLNSRNHILTKDNNHLGKFKVQYEELVKLIKIYESKNNIK